MIASKNVSICLLTYNRADKLPQTLDSLLSQTFPDFELIICDDYSTDGTEEVCLAYRRLDHRIRYFRNSQNLGMPGNLNYSLQLAGGDYLANLHDGDVYHPQLIELWKSALDLNPEAGFVFNAYRSINTKGITVEYRHEFPYLIPGHVLARRMLSQWDSPVFGTVMARREVYERLGWFDPKFGNFSDVDMWLRIACNYDVAYVDQILIDLMPVDPTRFYSFVHWKVIFWLLGIHVKNLERFARIDSSFAQSWSEKYPARRRAWMLRNFLICIKHKRWDRVKEGLAIWKDSDDKILRLIGSMLGKNSDAPTWYDGSTYWTMIRKPDINFLGFIGR